MYEGFTFSPHSLLVILADGMEKMDADIRLKGGKQ